MSWDIRDYEGQTLESSYSASPRLAALFGGTDESLAEIHAHTARIRATRVRLQADMTALDAADLGAPAVSPTLTLDMLSAIAAKRRAR